MVALPEDAPRLRDVYRARRRSDGLLRRTPLTFAPALTERSGAETWLKDETQQVTGAFKVRGAASKLRALGPEAVRRGVVAVSTGNHGRAVAHVARAMGGRATVFVSERVPANKLRALEDAGADVRVGGAGQDEAEAAAAELVRREGLPYVPPFDDPEVIAGQGTLGLEIMEDLPDVRTVLVPLSGGGLLAGVASAVKGVAPETRVIGVCMHGGAAMAASLGAGRPVQLAEADTLADSLQGGIGLENRYTFALVRESLDELVLVDEEAIAAAMRFAFREHRLVLEGAAAVGVAALLEDAARVRGPAAVVASGGNVDPDRFLGIVAGGGAPAGKERATR